MSSSFLDLDGLTAYNDGLAKVYTRGKSITITILASSWSNGDTFIENPFFLSDDKYSYFVGATKNSRKEYQDCGVEADGVPFNGVMTFKALRDPSEDLEIDILRLEV